MLVNSIISLTTTFGFADSLTIQHIKAGALDFHWREFAVKLEISVSSSDFQDSMTMIVKSVWWLRTNLSSAWLCWPIPSLFSERSIDPIIEFAFANNH